MAGDWIVFEHATLTKPEVFEIANILGISLGDALYGCLKVWCWADANVADGDVFVTHAALLNSISGVTQFAEAMLKVGWLRKIGDAGDKVSFTHFDYLMSQSAKKRAHGRKRTKKWRDALVTQRASPEKRREESNKPPKPPLERGALPEAHKPRKPKPRWGEVKP